MEDSHHELLALVERLRSDVSELRLRVSAIEAKLGLAGSAPVLTQVQTRRQSNEPAEELEEPQAASWAPLFGWAFLGISGAYVLRAATESSVIPALGGVVAGVLYAAFWLSTAAVRAATNPFAASVYAVTAVAIMTPLLWEATIRFRVVSGAGAAAVLVAFTAFGLAIAWRHRITAVACVAVLTGLLLPAALFRETHQGGVWAATVLAIAAAVEFSACRDHWLGLRWVSAFVADSTILALTLVVTSRGTSDVASSMSVLGAQVGLLVIYLASTADRTLVRRLPITPFEIGQMAVAFAVSTGGALRLAEMTSIGWTPVGVFCLAAGATCYGLSFGMVDRHAQPSRNFYTYSTFGLVLAVSGCWLLLRGEHVVIAFSALACCLGFAGLLGNRRTLRVHCIALLALAAAKAGVVERAWIAIIRSENRTLGAGYLAVLVAAFLVYGAVMAFRRRPPEDRASRLETFVPAVLFAWLAIGAVSTWPVFAAAPARTALVAACCLAAARLGARMARAELSWVAYTLVLGAGLKFFVDDLRAATSLSVVVSLALFGLTLIALPRIARVPPAAHTTEGRMTARAGSSG